MLVSGGRLRSAMRPARRRGDGGRARSGNDDNSSGGWIRVRSSSPAIDRAAARAHLFPAVAVVHAEERGVVIHAQHRRVRVLRDEREEGGGDRAVSVRADAGRGVLMTRRRLPLSRERERSRKCVRGRGVREIASLPPLHVPRPPPPRPSPPRQHRTATPSKQRRLGRPTPQRFAASRRLV